MDKIWIILYQYWINDHYSFSIVATTFTLQKIENNEYRLEGRNACGNDKIQRR